uniref:Uncharacterized protein n=1 Tax=Rhizophora mucronata TaxID=61149 RepID=A0A2P2R0D3_RHIMU
MVPKLWLSIVFLIRIIELLMLMIRIGVNLGCLYLVSVWIEEEKGVF